MISVGLWGGDRRKELLTSRGGVEIKNDVWIGQGVIILPGVTIEDGCIVAAGSIVTKSLPPYSIAAGVPARIIKRRFPDDEIKLLLQMKWWDWSERDIAACIPLLESSDVDGLNLFYKNKIVGEKAND